MVEYPKYDNYDAINIDRVKDIPKDYYGIMGVPIWFLTKYNPKQFEIIGSSGIKQNAPEDVWKDVGLGYEVHINGEAKYKRLFIRRRKYPKYDNYDAIEVRRVKDIPKDYYGVMGVPVWFLTKYNPKQFEIVGFRIGDDGKDVRVNGKPAYFRVFIRRRKNAN